MKQNKWVTILTIVFCILIVGAGGVLGYHYYRDDQASTDARFLSTMIREEAVVIDSQGNPLHITSPEDGVAVPPTNRQRFQELCAANPDFYGWISIDGTELNYPVMHSPDEPEKYLHQNFYGEYSKSGLPFMDAGCSTEVGLSTSNWIIYGHNMKNTTMFSSLLKYKDEIYWREHPTICFETLDGTMEFEIVGAFYSKIYEPDEEGFRYAVFRNAESEQEYDEFIRQVKENALYSTGINAQYGDQLLTLSTCSYHTDNGRFAVVARIKK